VTSPHYARLPPEINSALIFAGPGAAPLLAAAKAWDGLAENLASSASSFFSVTSDLANGSWQGASSAAMMAVATRYVSWLSAAAVQAEAASSQASAIAAAFETALEATVQPAVVSANRALVQALASGNHLGQNAPAIADIEAAYEQMWASDVVAMSGYHADASAAVAKLTPWQQVVPKLDLGNNVSQSVGPGNSDTGSLGLLNSGHYVTGGVNPNLSSGVLNSATAGTGFNLGVTSPGLFNRP
jgi:PPE-repeat protein